MNMPWQTPVRIGREMDTDLAVLSGEASHQRVKQPEPDTGSAVALWEELPSQPGARRPDYYDLPLLKEPVWIWSVPAYFYVGGVAGGSALLAALLHRRRGYRTLAGWCRLFAFMGSTL